MLNIRQCFGRILCSLPLLRNAPGQLLLHHWIVVGPALAGHVLGRLQCNAASAGNGDSVIGRAAGPLLLCLAGCGCSLRRLGTPGPCLGNPRSGRLRNWRGLSVDLVLHLFAGSKRLLFDLIDNPACVFLFCCEAWLLLERGLYDWIVLNLVFRHAPCA